MSNPLSSLKKQHKSPFTNAGQRPMPFRNPAYSDDESKLLEEITGGMASQRLRTRDPFSGGLPKLPDVSPRMSQGFGTAQKPSAAGPSDHELMSTMMSRITQLESKLAYQAKELNDKDKKIKVLTDKVRLLQKSQETDTHSHIAELENKCYLLQDQIQDMETFLADYGMIWVGNQSGDDSDDDSDSGGDQLWRPASSVSQQPKFRVDYNRLFENIKDLNALAGEGVASVTHTKDGARLKMPDAVQLTVYANGIFMFSGPFRPFSDTVTQSFMQDILDGYFPSELQARYPDGVPFHVTDKREVHFEDKRAEVFTGAGQTLGGETKPSRLVPTKLQDSKVSSTQTSEPVSEKRETTSEKPGPQITVEQFLQKLPRSVIRSGKVIDIRSSVGDTIHGGAKHQTDLTVIETDTVLEMKKRLEGEDSGRPFTPRDITTLRVKSEDGNHTYILKMKFSNTVGDLRNYIKSQRGEGTPDFDIVSAYPNKTHSNDNVTLHDAGLTPNAVAHLKVRK
ncbi:UBX domain-containing protein 11-like isoform X2 [Mercenaria mercenaria]|uniref:UBX domain-containing protein 11-like isoform X2 n=1 Tax=Mercenaria mercenaria TaxID=6596 RepID=UPI00234E5212|nr:UBX domain-containing protein 11-like isoform X2 [Mercenaria mercenaria]